MKKYRVWAEINLAALEKNIRTIRERLPREVGMIAVVKADAYGHGALAVARTALEHGAEMLGVGDSSEAIELRELGILSPILILGALIEEEVGWVVSYDILPTLHAPDMIPLLENEAARQKKRVKVHIKVDTGMVRLGASTPLAVEMAGLVANSPWLELDGVCTHLSSSGEADQTFTDVQISRFENALDHLEQFIDEKTKIHAANSTAIFTRRDARFNFVRPGIAMYGIDTGDTTGVYNSMEPVLSLHTQICFKKGVCEDTPVGYGRTATTGTGTMLATLPVGYNDGYPYALSNKSAVLIRGRRAPVLGTVTMDYTVVDIGGVEGVEVGDEVVLIGKQGKEEITVAELASLMNTIPYEIPCMMGKRVRRIYVRR